MNIPKTHRAVYRPIYLGMEANGALRRKQKLDSTISEVFGGYPKFVACIEKHGKYLFAENIVSMVKETEVIDLREAKNRK